MFEKNLTQKELASLAGTKQERISEWLNGVRNPSLNSIKKLSQALNVDINYFMENVLNTEKKDISNFDINEKIDLINKNFEEKFKIHETEIKILKDKIKLLENKI